MYFDPLFSYNIPRIDQRFLFFSEVQSSSRRTKMTGFFWQAAMGPDVSLGN